MSLETRFNDFKNKHNLSDDAIAEILVIFNESFIELAHKLLNTVPANTTTSSSKASVPKAMINSANKKFATKIAAEYAAENDLTLDDFSKEKVTKKDIDELLKSKSKTSMPTLKTVKREEPVKKTVVPAKNQTLCRGLNKNGDPCNKPATTQPPGSSNCFCFRHAVDWKNYEISDDSDLEEETVFTDLAITTED